jgi:hypothetical protein
MSVFNPYGGAFGTSIFALAYLYVYQRHKVNKIFYALATTSGVAKASNNCLLYRNNFYAFL